MEYRVEKYMATATKIEIGSAGRPGTFPRRKRSEDRVPIKPMRTDKKEIIHEA